MSGPIPARCPTIERERRLLRRGCLRVAGLDEAGRGAWAGPLAAAAVILPVRLPKLRALLAGVRDSKELTPQQRAVAAESIRSVALAWAVGSAAAGEIDQIGPLRATHLAMRRALAGLDAAPDHLLIDYLHLPDVDFPQTAVLDGDTLCLSIAAASILAKTWRDGQMIAMETRFPGYGFDRHKGYGTDGHAEMLARLGPCPEHRRSYEPIRRALETPPV